MSSKITPTVFYRTLNVEGLEIFYREAGPREAHPLCIYLYLRICHGNACPASEYAPYETASGSTG
jgi:hypothetical protein